MSLHRLWYGGNEDDDDDDATDDVVVPLFTWKSEFCTISSACDWSDGVGDSMCDVLFESVLLTYELPTDDAELLVRECVGNIMNSCYIFLFIFNIR